MSKNVTRVMTQICMGESRKKLTMVNIDGFILKGSTAEFLKIYILGKGNKIKRDKEKIILCKSIAKGKGIAECRYHKMKISTL